MKIPAIRIDQIGVIIRKEILETIRESKILLTGVILPLVIYPILIFAISSFQNHQEEKLRHKAYRVGLQGDPVTIQPLLEKSTNQFSMIESKLLTSELHNELFDFGLNIIPGVHTNSWEFWLLFSGSNEDSVLGQSAFAQLLNENREMWLYSELTRLGIPEQNPIRVQSLDVSTPEARSGFSLGKIVPLLLIMILVGGCSYTAIDLIAGEKERGCFETLLVSSVLREEVIIGKFSIVLLSGLVSVVLNLFSMFITMKLGLFKSSTPGSIDSFQISPMTIMLVFISLFPIAILFSALLIQFASRAQSYQHGQIMLLPFSLGVMLPCLVAFMPGMHSNSYLAAIPVANTVIVIKEVLEGTIHVPAFILSNLFNLFYSFIFLRTAVKALREEDSLVLVVHDGVSRAELLRDPVKAGLTAFAIIWLIMYFVMAPLQTKSAIPGLMVTLYGLCLISGILLPRIMSLPLRTTLQLQLPSLRSWISLVFALPGTVMIVMVLIQFQNQIMTMPESFFESFNDLLVNNNLSIWMSVFVFAISPGICEEFLFRGGLMGIFRSRVSIHQSVWISALCFGLMHFSIFRLGPTLLIGAILGYIAYLSRSIFPAIVLHAAYNALLIHFGETLSSEVPISLYLAGGVSLLFICFWLLRRDYLANQYKTNPNSQSR